jgi:hypothetical protein
MEYIEHNPDMFDLSFLGKHFNDADGSIEGLGPVYGGVTDHLEDEAFSFMMDTISSSEYTDEQFVDIINRIEHLSDDQWHDVLQALSDRVMRYKVNNDLESAKRLLAHTKYRLSGKPPMNILQSYPPFARIL